MLAHLKKKRKWCSSNQQCALLFSTFSAWARYWEYQFLPIWTESRICWDWKMWNQSKQSSYPRLQDLTAIPLQSTSLQLFSDKTDVCNDVCELLGAVQCCAMRWGHKCKDCSRPCWSSDQHCWQQPCLSHQCSLRALSCFEVACCVKILSNIDSISSMIKICSLWNKVVCYMWHPQIL